MKALPEFRKKHYAYYGLIYEMNRYYLEEKGLKYVNDGARSITNHSNMQPFLIEKSHLPEGKQEATVEIGFLASEIICGSVSRFY